MMRSSIYLTRVALTIGVLTLSTPPLQKDGGHWRIVNVVADGVSDLSLRRAEYTETMQKKGFTALIAHLKAQIAGYAKGS